MAKTVDYYYSVYRFKLDTDEVAEPFGAFEVVTMPNRQMVIYAGKKKQGRSLYNILLHSTHVEVHLLRSPTEIEATLLVSYEDVEELPLVLNAAASAPSIKKSKEGFELVDQLGVALEGVCLYGCKYEFRRVGDDEGEENR